jgi:hypothetical protein
VRCSKCDATERGEGWWGWEHDRSFWEVSDDIDRLLMLRAHFPFTCGVMTDLFPIEYLERVREENEVTKKEKVRPRQPGQPVEDEELERPKE